MTMNFILNPNPLPIKGFDNRRKVISKPAEGYQYYAWQHKQKLQAEEKQRKTLELYLRSIEEQQQIQRCRDSKSKRKVHHDGDFYEYSTQWKKRVQNKVDHEKIVKDREIIKLQQNAMRPRDHSKPSERKQISGDYKGPIEGWQQHFQNYLKRKSDVYVCQKQDEQHTFEPRINDRSKKMTQGIIGKVEDRLIMFGELIKMKNQQQLIRKQAQCTINGQPNISSKIDKYSSNQSDLFYKLFKEGEEINKRKREVELNDRYTFHPKINKLTEQEQSKILKNKKPLYYVKSELASNNSFSGSNMTGVQNKSINKADFEAFLKRNQALIESKKKNMMLMRQHMEQKQNIQRSHCTFSPSLNKNSKNMQRKVQMQKKQQQNKFQSALLSHCEPPPLFGEQTQMNVCNINDISKVTVQQGKDGSSICNQSDSLSIYNAGHEQSRAGKLTSVKSTKRQTEYDTCLTNIMSKQNGEDNIQKKMSLPSEEINIDQIVTHEQVDAAKSNLGNQDSIEQIKKYEWESEMGEIQHHLQNMIARASQ